MHLKYQSRIEILIQGKTLINKDVLAHLSRVKHTLFRRMGRIIQCKH